MTGDAIRLAASVLLLRDHPAEGVEVLLLRRAERAGDYRSGAAVFPGGALDPADAHATGFLTGWSAADADARLGVGSGALKYVAAAVRECLEEVGLLAVDTVAPAAAARAQAEWRSALQSGTATLSAMCQALGVELDVGGWRYLAHWVTPPGLPRRFDTRFFVTRAPEGQEASPDRGEAQELVWRSPARALAAPASGPEALTLLPVTRELLRWLSRFDTVAAALAGAHAATPVPCVMPRLGRSGTRVSVVLPWEPAYDEIARLDPEGTGDAWHEIIPGRVVQLSRHVRRVTAPNPGLMTGPGTNSYLVGDPERERWTVIDPGPDDAAHLDALLAAAPGVIERIVLTHTHPDHAAGARPLAERTGAPISAMPAAAVPAAEPPATAPWAPDVPLRGGERLLLGPGCTLRVLYTPGHASDHLALLLEEDRMLFSGDLVMQGGTVVIDPPDGDMAAYLGSLRAMDALELEWIAPGHGFLIAASRRPFHALLAHRQAREARVVAALRRRGMGSPESLVRDVYEGTPEAALPLACRSLLAHLLKLEADGTVQRIGPQWSLSPTADA